METWKLSEKQHQTVPCWKYFSLFLRLAIHLGNQDQRCHKVKISCLPQVMEPCETSRISSTITTLVDKSCNLLGHRGYLDQTYRLRSEPIETVGHLAHFSQGVVVRGFLGGAVAGDFLGIWANLHQSAANGRNLYETIISRPLAGNLKIPL